MKAPKPKQILIMGDLYFVNRVKELGRNSDYVFQSMPKTGLRRWLVLWQSDLIYLIGGDLRPNRFYRFAFLMKKKMIIHWTGTDMVEMRRWRDAGKSFCPFLLNKALHWAEVKWTARELAELGVRAEVVPLTPASFPAEIKELPDKFVVLTYLPPGKALFYGENQIVKLAGEFPEIVFLAVATSPTSRPPEWPDNLIPIGWVDNMGELYREVSLLIRLTEHDGLSFMVLEALAHGRQVIWSYPFPGVIQVTEYQELLQNMKNLYRDYQKGKLKINRTGREICERYYNPQVVWGRIQTGLEEALSE